jgi:hypothetical protein
MDTIALTGGDQTIIGGNGNDLVDIDDDANNFVRLGNGSDTVDLNEGSQTVILGNGRDRIADDGGTGPEGAVSIKVGNGSDTIDLGTVGDGAFTIRAGNGKDLLHLDNGTYSIHLGNGSDTVTNETRGAATIVAGNGRDSVSVGEGSWSIRLGNGNDTVHVTGGDAHIVLGRGNDSVFYDGSGVVSVGSGQDTVHIDSFIGTVTAGNGSDKVTVTNASALVKVGNGNDTVIVSGAVSVRLGNGHDQFVDQHPTITSRGGSHNNISVQGGAGHDTFTYEYTDFGKGGAGDLEGTAGDGAVAVEPGQPTGFYADGRLVISHFTHKDVLNFNDYTEQPGNIFPASGITQTEANAHMTVTDAGLHHNVTIVIDTAGGNAAGTIVLKGIGTANHHFNSIDALAAAYHLHFSPAS